MDERIKIDPDDVLVREVSLELIYDDLEFNLRNVSGRIEARVGVEGDEITAIGSLDGHVAWQVTGWDVFDSGDAIGADGVVLGTTCYQIMWAYPEIFSALLIDRLVLKAHCRGNGLTKEIVTRLMALLQLEPSETAVVLVPVPLDDEGRVIEGGAERDARMPKLQSAYRAAGFEPWKGSDEAWWLPVPQRSRRREATAAKRYPRLGDPEH